MTTKIVPVPKRASNVAARLTPHQLAGERRTLLQQLEDVQLAIDVARAFAIEDDDDDDDDDDERPCRRAVLSLCDAVQSLSNAVKQSRRR